MILRRIMAALEQNQPEYDGRNQGTESRIERSAASSNDRWPDRTSQLARA
jgi:hypothetical protein